MRREVVSPPPRRSLFDAAAFATAVVVATLCSLAVMIMLAEAVDDSSIAQLVPMPIGAASAFDPSPTVDPPPPCGSISVRDVQACVMEHPHCVMFVGCTVGPWTCAWKRGECSYEVGIVYAGVAEVGLDYSMVTRPFTEPR